MEPQNQKDRLSEKVSEAMFSDWDPVGVSDFPEARDEYDSYVADICSLLNSQAPEAQLIDYLRWLEVEQMGLLGNRWQRAKFARRLLKIRDECIGDIS